MKIGNWNYADHGPMFIAEVGVNHNGDPALAGEMLRAAATAGATTVKFQVHITDEEMVRGGPTADYVEEPFDKLMDRVFLGRPTLEALMEECRQQDVMFLATPFSYAAADMLDKMGVVAFKTGSGELTNTPLLARIAQKGRPMIVSTGMSTLDEVERSVQAIYDFHPASVGQMSRIRELPLTLMHCVSSYPTAPRNMNLPRLQALKEFDVPVGISDHSPGFGVAIAAIGMGAQIVEKHFTTDRALPGPDQSASLEPDEFRTLVTEGRRAFLALRDVGDGIQPAEVDVREMAGHSVVTARAISKGKTIQAEDLTTKRPATGIPAAQLTEVYGAVAQVDIPSNTVVRWEHLGTVAYA